MTSEQVQSIVAAVRGLDEHQRLQFTSALAAIDLSRPAVSTNRKQLVDSIKGKYRHVPTSSELFSDVP